MGMIKKIKNKLATVKNTSWRFSITSTIWDQYRIKNAKACSFYWWYLPTSLLAYLAIGILGALWAIFGYLVVYPVAWIIGRSPSSANIYEPDFNEYKENAKGTPKKVVPWEILLPLAILIPIVIVIFTGNMPWKTVLLTLAGIVIVLGLIIGIGAFITNDYVKKNWSKICPSLKVVNENEA